MVVSRNGPKAATDARAANALRNQSGTATKQKAMVPM